MSPPVGRLGIARVPKNPVNCLFLKSLEWPERQRQRKTINWFSFSLFLWLTLNKREYLMMPLWSQLMISYKLPIPFWAVATLNKLFRLQYMQNIHSFWLPWALNIEDSIQKSIISCPHLRLSLWLIWVLLLIYFLQECAKFGVKISWLNYYTYSNLLNTT